MLLTAIHKYNLELNFKKWLIYLCHFFFISNPISGQKSILFVGDSYTSVNDLTGTFELLCKIKNKDIKCVSNTYDGTNWNVQVLNSTFSNEINYKISQNNIDYIVFQSLSLVQPNSFKVCSQSLEQFRIKNPKLPVIICNDFNSGTSFPLYYCSKTNLNNEVECNTFNNQDELINYRSDVIKKIKDNFFSVEFCDNSLKRDDIQVLIGQENLQNDEQGHPTKLLQCIKAYWIFLCLFHDELSDIELTQFLKIGTTEDKIIESIIKICK